ncbi:MAG: hypothetical protein FJZ59_02815 [Chlamydiae bacterium]|nr:hypothetical protein [Chlamydiota bacterium]
MPNHIHLALELNQVSLSEILQNIAARYTRYINLKYKQSGY